MNITRLLNGTLVALFQPLGRQHLLQPVNG
jgi:hypothetical protein